MDLYFRRSYQEVPGACVLDITPPTFAGITGLSANADGSLTASWGSATDAVLPIEFDVYVQASTATGLFASGNLQQSTYLSSTKIFTEASGVSLSAGQTYFVGVRARDRSGNVNTNTVSLSAISTGVSFAGIAAQVWNSNRASFVLAGSFGEANQGVVSIARANNLDNLDATVSSRSTSAQAVSILADTATLLSRLTNTRAALLDNLSLLDVAISTRGTSLQSLGILADTATLLSRLTSGRALLLDNLSNLDATISSVLTAISAIPVVTPPTVAQIADGVWDELVAGHNSANTFGANAQSPSINPTDVADAVWDALTVNHSDAGSFGANAQAPAINPTQVADAVWDAVMADHLDSGSTGEKLNSSNGSDPEQIAIAVWNQNIASATVEDSFGGLVKKLKSSDCPIQSKIETNGELSVLVSSNNIVAKITDVADLNC